jgi:putative serine protease PepD
MAAAAASAEPSVVTIQTPNGEGSGVVISNDGRIVTNAHVVESFGSVTVVLADGTQLPGQVLGTDPVADIAVVIVHRPGLPVAQLGSALSLHIGDRVVAVGDPLGLPGSVSSGVVSALGRIVPDQTGTLRAAIQTDAAINPGNSGGALLDLSGRVVGITAAKATGTAVQSIGFAIPIDVAKAVAADLTAGRTPSHPYLGATAAQVAASTAQALGDTPGAKLETVTAGGPAATAGLKAGDVITAADGVHIGSMFDLSVFLGTHHAGDPVTVILSDGRQLPVILAERPAA